MDTAIEVYQEHIWTFTRSTTPIIVQREGLVLRASWKHANSFFQVWEPEVADFTKVPPYKRGMDSFLFFESDKGAPYVCIFPAGPASCREALVTKEPTIVDWVTARNPITFQVPKVIYSTKRHGFTCDIITQLPGRSLESVITDILGCNDQGYLNDPAPDSAPAIKIRQICAPLSSQVADAIMEMSTWEAPVGVSGVSGVDGGFVSDWNFWENARPYETKSELIQNLEHAELDWVNTIFSPGDISAENIIIDEDNNFVGFSRLLAANFVPRNWISVGMIDRATMEEADISIYWNATLLTNRHEQGSPDSILEAWSNLLWEQLAGHGFIKINPHRLAWRRRRSGNQHNGNLKWRQLDKMIREKGMSAWYELVKETEPDWYEVLKPKT